MAPPTVVAYRALRGKPGPLGIFGMFRRHQWYCAPCVRKDPRLVSDARGSLIVKDDEHPHPYHMNIMKEQDLMTPVRTLEGMEIPAAALAALYGFRIILSLDTAVYDESCAQCGTPIA